jgi:hypothetical protein
VGTGVVAALELSAEVPGETGQIEAVGLGTVAGFRSFVAALRADCETYPVVLESVPGLAEVGAVVLRRHMGAEPASRY